MRPCLTFFQIRSWKPAVSQVFEAVELQPNSLNPGIQKTHSKEIGNYFLIIIISMKSLLG